MLDIIVDGIYADSEGKEYSVFTEAHDTETGQLRVVYRQLDSARERIVSPLNDFKERFTYLRTADGVEVLNKLAVYGSTAVPEIIEGILIGGIYTHFKGNKYKALYVAHDSESAELRIIYKALYGESLIWDRPLKMFLEKVTRGDKTFDRFTLGN